MMRWEWNFYSEKNYNKNKNIRIELYEKFEVKLFSGPWQALG